MPALRVESPACTGGFVMPVLELSDLITAIRGYGSGTANQKMVMKCMFGVFFALFTIFWLLVLGEWHSVRLFTVSRVLGKK